jgi:hypothetical protein
MFLFFGFCFSLYSISWIFKMFSFFGFCFIFSFLKFLAGFGFWEVSHLCNFSQYIRCKFSIFFMFRSQITLPSGGQVQNIGGSSVCGARSYNSWKGFYQGGKRGHNTRPWPAECRIYRCTNVATLGGHVFCVGQNGVWIIPMCGTHNSFSNVNLMTVNAGTTLVKVEEENTSGPPGPCFRWKKKTENECTVYVLVKLIGYIIKNFM